MQTMASSATPRRFWMKPLTGIFQPSGQISSLCKESAMAYNANSNISHRALRVTVLRTAAFQPAGPC